jgi:hypothetical protein
VGGVDDRLAFVVPQYIGGNNQLGNVWYAYYKEHPGLIVWDPANFYRQPKGKAHWLWINDINDKYGLLPMTTKSWQETGPHSWMTLLPTLGHGTFFTETGKNAVREIYAFADSVTRGTPPLAHILTTTLGNDEVTLTWQATQPITRAQLCYTTETIPDVELGGESRKDWERVRYTVTDVALPPVTILPDGTHQATFLLPTNMRAGFINLIDERDLTVSSELLSPHP